MDCKKPVLGPLPYLCYVTKEPHEELNKWGYPDCPKWGDRGHLFVDHGVKIGHHWYRECISCNHIADYGEPNPPSWAEWYDKQFPDSVGAKLYKKQNKVKKKCLRHEF